MKNFDYLEPESVAEASAQLRAHGDDSVLIAGGTALLLALRLGLVEPSYLVSLERVAGVNEITFSGNEGLRLGAMIRHADIERHPLIIENYPILAEMASVVAGPQIRNRGTLGGNLCYGDPASDPPAVLLVLDATVTLEDDSKSRSLPLSEFLVGYYETALAPGEILTEIQAPPQPRNSGAAYIRHTITGMEERPFLGIAARLTLDGDRSCAGARLAVSAIAPVAQRLTQTETLLVGKELSEAAFAAAADAAAQEVAPISDYKASEDYRRHVVGVMTKRILRQAAQRAQAAASANAC